MNVITASQLTKESIKALYNNVFIGLGKLGHYHITLQGGYTPAVHLPQRVAHPSKTNYKRLLKPMLIKSGVLVKAD